MTTPPPLRFGIWANVYGTWASLQHPEDPLDASWDRNKRQVLLAERLGFESTLLAQHTVNPFGHHYDQLEAWSAAAALAAITERIEIIIAIKPLLYHPVVLAKQALQIEEISGGRAAINLVNAWYKPEIEPAGDVRSRPRSGAPVRFGLAAFVIARDSDEEAEEALAYAWELAGNDQPALAHVYGNADPKAVMFQTFQKYPHIGTNGGTAAGLVGSYDTVAERIRGFNELGIELLMLQFQPFEAEMQRFAEHVIPRVRLPAAVV